MDEVNSCLGGWDLAKLEMSDNPIRFLVLSLSSVTLENALSTGVMDMGRLSNLIATSAKS